MHVMNEYMAIDDAGGKRLATFPDCHHDARSPTGTPLSVGQLREGMYVFDPARAEGNHPAVGQRLDPTVYPVGREGDGHRDREIRAVRRQGLKADGARRPASRNCCATSSPSDLGSARRRCSAGRPSFSTATCSAALATTECWCGWARGMTAGRSRCGRRMLPAIARCRLVRVDAGVMATPMGCGYSMRR